MNGTTEGVWTNLSTSCVENECNALDADEWADDGIVVTNASSTTVSGLGEVSCAANYTGQPVITCADGSDFEHSCQPTCAAYFAQGNTCAPEDYQADGNVPAPFDSNPDPICCLPRCHFPSNRWAHSGIQTNINEEDVEVTLYCALGENDTALASETWVCRHNTTESDMGEGLVRTSAALNCQPMQCPSVDTIEHASSTL